MLYVYPKSERDDLATEQLRQIKKAVEKKCLRNKELLEELIESVKQGGAIGNKVVRDRKALAVCC